MKKILLSMIAVSALVAAACSSSKKSTASSEPTKAPATTTAPTTEAGPARSTNGIYAPGKEELAAIQAQYKDVTLETLSEGHSIYVGACTNCHGAKSIYNRPVEAWDGIMNSMAPKANLTAAQKDAVMKYVLAIKATQPKK